MSPKALILVLLAAVSLASGAVDQYFFPGQPFSPVAFASGLIGIVLIFMWFRLDANAVSYRRSPGLNVSVIVLPIVALPYYFFRSRGAKRGAIACVALLLAYIVFISLSYAGEYATYYGLQS